MAVMCMSLAAWAGHGDELSIDTLGRKVGMGEGQDSVLFSRIKRMGLQVLDIELVDGEWPTADYVWAPSGSWGQGIQNATKVPGRMRIFDRDSVIYDTGEYVDSVSGMTLKIRGNSTAWYDKKPYKIKLQKKADLLQRDTIDGRDKNWILIRDEVLKTMMGFEVNRALGMTWTPGYRYVNVVINNRYEGVYMLVEQVRRNTDCRLNVSKQGYIFECDPYWWNEPLYLPSLLFSHFGYTFKYPEPEDFTAADSTYMTGLLSNMDCSYIRDNYPEVIDVPSYAAWCLGHDILGTKDFAGANQYFLKYDKSDTTRVVMPLLWDFDSAEGDTATWSQPHIQLMYYLFRNPNKAFVNAFVDKWNSVQPTLYETIYAKFEKMRHSKEGTAFSLSMQLNNQRWGTTFMIYSNFVYRPEWIRKRVIWLTREIAKLSPVDGDIDLNGKVDVADVNMLINMILEQIEPQQAVADLNGDGLIDVADLDLLIRILIAE